LVSEKKIHNKLQARRRSLQRVENLILVGENTAIKAAVYTANPKIVI